MMMIMMMMMMLLLLLLIFHQNKRRRCVTIAINSNGNKAKKSILLLRFHLTDLVSFGPYEYLSVCPSVLHGKIFNNGQYTHTFQPFFISATLIITIYCCIVYHFQWPWPWLGVTRSTWNKPSWFYFLAHFSADRYEIKYSAETIQVRHLDRSTIFERNFMKQRSNCCFTDRVKTTTKNSALAGIRVLMNWSLIRTLYDDRCYWTVHFDASLVDLNLDSRSQDCEKTKTYLRTYAHRSRWSIGHLRPLTIDLCSRLLWRFHTNWSLAVSALLQCLASSKTKTTHVISLKENNNSQPTKQQQQQQQQQKLTTLALAHYSDICESISLKLGMMK